MAAAAAAMSDGERHDEENPSTSAAGELNALELYHNHLMLCLVLVRVDWRRLGFEILKLLAF